MTNTGYVELISSDVRDLVVEKVEAEKLQRSCCGQTVNTKKNITRIAGQPDAALREAADL